MIDLTSTNYHSIESNKVFMSNSQLKDFLDCEVMAMAVIDGIHKKEDTVDKSVGSFTHAWNEGVLEQFKADNPGLFLSRGDRKGELKADYLVAEKMISVVQNDEFMMDCLSGQKEVIMTAELFGTPWKIKMDSYIPGVRFCDLKTTCNMNKKYWLDDQNRYGSFIEAFGYVRQIAIYSEIERIATGGHGWIQGLIAVVTKEDYPNKAVLSFEPDFIGIDPLQRELDKVEAIMPRILSVKSGEVAPTRCEKCAYCRSTKQLDRVIHYSELVG